MTSTDPDKAGEDAGSGGPQTITLRRVLVWSLPFFASLLVLAATFALHWEPWFGYASVVAGALGSLMLAGEALGLKGG